MNLAFGMSREVDQRSHAQSVAETVLLAVWHYQPSDDTWAGSVWPTEMTGAEVRGE